MARTLRAGSAHCEAKEVGRPDRIKASAGPGAMPNAGPLQS